MSAQFIILELASKFVPSDTNEIFDIMNLLEDRLQHANGAVVLATIKVFLHLTMSMTDVHQQVHMFLVIFYYLRYNFLLHHSYVDLPSCYAVRYTEHAMHSDIKQLILHCVINLLLQSDSSTVIMANVLFELRPPASLQCCRPSVILLHLSSD